MADVTPREGKDDRIRTCYVALIDILGFKQLIESGPLGESAEKLDRLQKIVSDIRLWDIFDSPAQSLDVRWFQDTLLVVTPTDTLRDLCNIVRYCTAVVGFSFADGIFLRGGITHGELFVTETAVLGQPIVRAYAMEQAQEWLGCWLDKVCVPEMDTDKLAYIAHDGLVFPYPIPMKSGPFRSHLALNWPRCLLAKGTLDLLIDGWRKFAGIQNPTHDVMRKIQNVDRFLEFLVARKWDPVRTHKPRPDEQRRTDAPADWLSNHQLYSVMPEYAEDNPLFTTHEGPAAN